MSASRFTGLAPVADVVARPTDPPRVHSRLEPRNDVRSIEEGLQARVKDPLWFLGRQWQTGEFRAHNGGGLVRVELDLSTKPLDRIARPGMDEAAPEPTHFDLKLPLEMKVEEEVATPSGGPRSENWDPRHLEYNFSVTDGDTRLAAEQYDGQRLDWHSFDLADRSEFDTATEHLALRPSLVTFPGAPLPRWWAFEDRRVDLGNIARPHLSFLTMLLVEFTLLHSNDWFVIPVRHPVGHIRHMAKVVALDSFGVVTEARPVVDRSAEKRGWEVFTIADTEGPSDGRLFYMPNNLYHPLQSEPFETVSFLRDEGANLVWAIEHRYEKAPGDVRNRHDEEAYATPELTTPDRYWDTQQGTVVRRSEIPDVEGELGTRYLGPLALYEPKSYVPAHWVPYLPRQVDPETGEFILRRGRTIEDLSAGPQYKGVLLRESKCVFGEEVPRSGIKVSRVYQLARDTDRGRHVWAGRKKVADNHRQSSSLRFDSLVEG